MVEGGQDKEMPKQLAKEEEPVARIPEMARVSRTAGFRGRGFAAELGAMGSFSSACPMESMFNPAEGSE